MKLRQLVESFVISNDEFEDYLERATEQMVSEIQSGKHPRDTVHDLSVQFSKQHNSAYAAYSRMSESLSARLATLEIEAGEGEMPMGGNLALGDEPMGIGDEMGMDSPEGGIAGMDVDMGDDMNSPEFSDDEVMSMDLGAEPDMSEFGESVKKPIAEGSDYEIYHDTYSAAIQHAIQHTRSVYGYDVDSDDYWNQIASGPRKPSNGKTNRFILDLIDMNSGEAANDKLHIQVYNTGKNYELNMYVQGGPKKRGPKTESQMNEGPWDSHNTDVRADRDVKIGGKNYSVQKPEKKVGYKVIHKASGKSKTLPSWSEAMALFKKLGGKAKGLEVVMSEDVQTVISDVNDEVHTVEGEVLADGREVGTFEMDQRSGACVLKIGKGYKEFNSFDDMMNFAESKLSATVEAVVLNDDANINLHSDTEASAELEEASDPIFDFTRNMLDQLGMTRLNARAVINQAQRTDSKTWYFNLIDEMPYGASREAYDKLNQMAHELWGMIHGDSKGIHESRLNKEVQQELFALKRAMKGKEWTDADREKYDDLISRLHTGSVWDIVSSDEVYPPSRPGKRYMGDSIEDKANSIMSKAIKEANKRKR